MDDEVGGEPRELPGLAALLIDQSGRDIASTIPQRDAPSTLYHYTDMEALRAIIQSGEVWFTDVRYMNDAGEIEYGDTLISRSVYSAAEALQIANPDWWAEEAINRLPGVVTTSALSLSEDDDSLPQWRGYSRGTGGVALGFQCYGPAGGFVAATPQPIELVPIEYDGLFQAQTLERLTRRHLELYLQFTSGGFERPLAERVMVSLRACLQTVASQFKSPHWRSEQEWRIAITHNALSLGDRLRFRTGAVGLTPYTSVALRHPEGHFANKLPLSEVVIGPGPYQELNRAAIGTFLHQKGYSPDRTRLRLSDIPLRFQRS
jgi:hypothetical protein